MTRSEAFSKLAALPLIGSLFALPAPGAAGELSKLVPIPQHLDKIALVKPGEMLVLRFPVEASQFEVVESMRNIKAAGVKVIALRGDIEMWHVVYGGTAYAAFPITPAEQT